MTLLAMVSDITSCDRLREDPLFLNMASSDESITPSFKAVFTEFLSLKLVATFPDRDDIQLSMAQAQNS